MLNCSERNIELIPEFYYLPEMFKNTGQIDFGYAVNKKIKINDVILPPWAENPLHFVKTLNNALESNIVSESLHQWINLIFGVYQQSISMNNLFRSCHFKY